MRRQLTPRIVALLTGMVLAVVSCSNSTPQTGTDGAPAGRTASAGSAAPSAQRTTGPAGPNATAATRSGATSLLPGLSADCTSAIHAQAAVNKLFGDAMGQGATSGTASRTLSAPTPLASAEVTEAFASIDPSVPKELTDQFKTLHDAATRAVGKPAVAVAAILNEKAVTDAMTAVADYIKACTPPTS